MAAIAIAQACILYSLSKDMIKTTFDVYPELEEIMHFVATERVETYAIADEVRCSARSRILHYACNKRNTVLHS